MLNIKNLYLKYTKEYFALYDINISVKKGESVAFCGDDDSGKTSLLRILAKLEESTSGEIYVKDIPLKKINFQSDVQMGYVPAVPVFFEKKTVYENFKYVLKTRKIDNGEIENKINNALIDFNIEKYKDVKIKDLTLKEKYIMSLVRLSLRELELVIIDNIFDKITEDDLKEIEELIKVIFLEKHVTTIIATTKQNIAKDLCSRVIEFKSGSVIK